MSDQAIKNQEELADISRRFMRDEITAEQAEAEAQVIANRVNEKAKEIAKKYNMPARTVKPLVTKSHGVELNHGKPGKRKMF